MEKEKVQSKLAEVMSENHKIKANSITLTDQLRRLRNQKADSESEDNKLKAAI